MGWQRVILDKDGKKITEYGSYWYEDIGQWIVALVVIFWVWVCLLVVAPWVWMYMKLTGHSCCVYRMTEEEINARNEQAALWRDRMQNFPQPGENFTPPPGM
jgi:hypothetical protein